MSIEVRGVTKRFGAFTAVDDVSLSVGQGELVALLGPSGSGKTTLLRVIAGLEAPDAGTVLFGGQDAAQRSLRERRVGFVFQHYALFRHMSVFENVAFGLRVRPRSRRPGRDEIRRRVEELLKLVQLDVLADRRPSDLSGGQRQRVALARALAVEPEVLLLDEPFGALDATVRKELRRWLRRLHKELQVASVFVTHDQEEALEVADRVVIMNRGRIEQAGAPEEVYDHPASPFVYSFLGSVNLFHGRVHKGAARLGDLAVEAPEHAATEDSPAVGYARPHDIDLARLTDDAEGVPARVRHVATVGPAVRLELERVDNGLTVQVEVSRERHAELALSPGDQALLKPRRLKVFVEDYSISAGRLRAAMCGRRRRNRPPGRCPGAAAGHARSCHGCLRPMPGRRLG